MASAEYRAVIKQLGEWPQLRDSAAVAGTRASPASISRQQLVEQLLAQMASDGWGGRAAAGTSLVSSSQDEPNILRNHTRGSGVSFGAAESWLRLLGAAESHIEQTAWSSQFTDVFQMGADQKHKPCSIYEQGWNPSVPQAACNDSLVRSLPSSENASLSIRGNTATTAEPKAERQRQSRRVPTTKLMVANSSEFRELVQKLTGLKPKSLAAGHDVDSAQTLKQQLVRPKPMKPQAAGGAIITPTWSNMSQAENPAREFTAARSRSSAATVAATRSSYTRPMDVDGVMSAATAQARFDTPGTYNTITAATTLNDIDNDQNAVQDHLLPHTKLESMWQLQLPRCGM